MRSRVLVLGKGMLGTAFERYGYTVWGRDKFDWSDSKPVYRGFDFEEGIEPFDVIVNCIAKSDTRWCEDPANFNELLSTNSNLPKYLSDICEEHKKKFVHISTGCVYDTRGRGSAGENDFTSSHCSYVVSKLVAEGYLRDKDLILRPRLLFDSRATEGRNNLIQKLPTFKAYLNEFNSITSCDTIVEGLGALLEMNQSGVFNIANSDVYTVYEMAQALGLHGEKIRQEDLHATQGLFLVNNVMDISKLSEFYIPRNTLVELGRCDSILKLNNKFHRSL